MHMVPFLSYVLVTTFTPGPNNIMSMVIAKEHGLRKAMRFTYGVAAGFLIIMVLCSFFNLVMLQFIPNIELAMTTIGALYMAYLAYKIITSNAKSNAQSEQRLMSFTSGLVLQFVNPKVILYGITAISTFIIPYHSSVVSLVLFSMFLAFMGLLSTSSWAAFGSALHNVLRKYQTPFNILMALLLVYSAVSLFF